MSPTQRLGCLTLLKSAYYSLWLADHSLPWFTSSSTTCAANILPTFALALLNMDYQCLHADQQWPYSLQNGLNC